MFEPRNYYFWQQHVDGLFEIQNDHVNVPHLVIRNHVAAPLAFLESRIERVDEM